ncbi:MAG: hypothetical protein M1828_002053 [Chrysothrix sp. TS-e1954]|nr:MAG: hypothetical protein M1828_002053 [Chrysothrix sp. TS-e1954]
MYDDQSHPLLAQVPLTVSPFVSLPTATTLPYTYKTLPSTLPPSSTEDRSGASDADQARPRYIVSASGQAARPDDIVASCRALETHLKQLQSKAQDEIHEWEASIRERELAEKRRVAPGWLDREEKILQPARSAAQGPSVSLLDDAPDESKDARLAAEEPTSEGDQLDRAFGTMRVT